MERREMDEIQEDKGLDSYRGRLDFQVKLCDFAAVPDHNRSKGFTFEIQVHYVC